MTPAAQEASGGNGSSDDLGLWSIDPIDGTTNFINGFTVFCPSPSPGCVRGAPPGGDLQPDHD
ncbi:MAG: hypothetical protein IPJ27_16595 [Candidatus Accumulibacter sp.]|uniref:Inositol monophosphatase n=1 Tax=Candidatus Accumulibacter proximus TaxID=2954385 RepID=A0A935PZI7_9PROT|nr:hypothetical protein [Candidatus Accumulibacter proximus]